MNFGIRCSAKLTLWTLFAPLIFVLSVVFSPVGFSNLPVNFSVKAALQVQAEKTQSGSDVANHEASNHFVEAELSDTPDAPETTEVASEDAPAPTVVLDEKAPCGFVSSMPTYERSFPWSVRAPAELFPISASTLQRPPLV